MATRTLEIQWDALVTKADPDWRREHGHPPQLPDEDLPIKRQLVTQDWRNSGVYARAAFLYRKTENDLDRLTEDGRNRVTES